MENNEREVLESGQRSGLLHLALMLTMMMILCNVQSVGAISSGRVLTLTILRRADEDGDDWKRCMWSDLYWRGVDAEKCCLCTIDDDDLVQGAVGAISSG